ncbi:MULTISPECIES: hypothetical protein [Streptomycetaceae]|uniref:Uncharacterized protein n=1 Tax=Streptantibioticus cattleyicolor (strain ATCC 35852 / DSM 46488 / JCM 4925 / NBRC 14057 / NRRL 8057) TaxID=1003195 RepID=G8WS36_STREN|nr:MULTISPECIES: hypothetical protein [Streptomycetaceae]AEW94796.1 hypothetical protein SCATT_24250 [Streptantibioticus cattleyicolor NRRL 8057 = DSM 46488]MYS59420.1 hypothetical protein [Streptomyces sp. SID5468]
MGRQVFAEQPEHAVLVAVGGLGTHLAQQFLHGAPLPQGMYRAKSRLPLARQ